MLQLPLVFSAGPYISTSPRQDADVAGTHRGGRPDQEPAQGCKDQVY